MEQQLVIFELKKEFFGVDIAFVEGIVKLQEITRIPQAPSYVEGITNLRGSVLPVIDLHKRFDMDVPERNDETRIVVANIGEKKVGMIVTAVSEVLTIEENIIEPPPNLTTNMKADFITGVAKIDERLVILIDIQKILTEDEKQQVEKLIK